MPSPAPQRRLAAILAADMVGYSRMIERDEAGTVARLKSDREEFIDPTISAHAGRIVRMAGDGALLEFPSVVEAAQCAIDIQRGMLDRNAARVEDERIVFRIGVNMGDIIVEDDNLHGEGINVAARLEGLCDPGGILLSEEAARHVEGKVKARLEFLEERTVKNIERPVRVWRVVRDVGEIPPRSHRSPNSSRTYRRLMPVGIAVAVAIAVTLWIQFHSPETKPLVSVERSVSRPDGPSLVVLPFESLSADPEQDYFADGISDDLITDLSQISELFVIARHTAFVYKGRSLSVERVGEELGVRYVLEGSVRRAGGRVRINAQLTDAVSGGSLWAERYDREMADIFDLQDEVAGRIVSRIICQPDTCNGSDPLGLDPTKR